MTKTLLGPRRWGRRGRWQLQRHLYAQREAALRRCLNDGLQLKRVPHKWRRDLTVVLAAVTQNPCGLKYADKRLRGCRSVVLHAVQLEGAALRFASDHLRNDSIVVSKAAEQNPCSFIYAGDRCKTDRALALTLLNKKVKILTYLSEVLQTDSEIVLAAVKAHPSELTNAPEQVAFSKDFILQACLARPDVLNYVWGPPELIDDKDLWLQAIKQRVDSARHVPRRWFSDLEFATEACQHSGRAFFYCADTLRAIKDLAMLACTTHGFAIRAAPPELQRDRDVILKAVSQDHKVLLYIGDEFRNDREIMLAAATQDSDALSMCHCCSSSWAADLTFMVELCSRNGSALEKAPWSLLNCRELVYAAVQSDGRAIAYVGKIRQADPNLAVLAAKNTYLCWNLLNPDHWSNPNVINALLGPQRRLCVRMCRRSVGARQFLESLPLPTSTEAQPLGAWHRPGRCPLGSVRLGWR